MPAIMADHDVEGDFDIVLRTLMSGEWNTLSTSRAFVAPEDFICRNAQEPFYCAKAPPSITSSLPVT